MTDVSPLRQMTAATARTDAPLQACDGLSRELGGIRGLARADPIREEPTLPTVR